MGNDMTTALTQYDAGYANAPGYITNIVVTHGNTMGRCGALSATTFMDPTVVHDVPITEYFANNSAVECLLTLDNIFDTDENINDAYYVNLTWNQPLTIDEYRHIEEPAIIRTGPSEEQFSLKNITVYDDYTVETYLYRSPLTNATCEVPLDFNVSLSELTGCTFTSSYQGQDGDTIVYSFQIDRTILLGCSSLPVVGNSYRYNVTVSTTALSYRVGGTQWVVDDFVCDLQRPMLDGAAVSQNLTMNLAPVVVTNSEGVEHSIFQIDSGSLRFDMSVCDGIYASPVASLAFDMSVIFPADVTVVPSEIYFLNMRMDDIYLLESVGTIQCVDNRCTQSFRSVDCLPVKMISNVTCGMDSSSDIFVEVVAVRAVGMYYEMSIATDPLLPVTDFVSGTCPVLADISNVNDQFPPSASVWWDGGDVVVSLEVPVSSLISVEIIDVHVSLYTPDGVLWSTMVFNKQNKLRGMTMRSSPYYSDAHFCRHQCEPLYDTSRVDILGGNGLYPICVLPEDATRAGGIDYFSFDGSGWNFKGYPHTTGTYDIVVTGMLYLCSGGDTTYASRILGTSYDVVTSELVTLKYRPYHVSYLPLLVLVIPMYHLLI